MKKSGVSGWGVAFLAVLLGLFFFTPARAGVNGTSSLEKVQSQAGNATLEEVAGNIRVRPAKVWFQEGEDIVVTVSGFPGNRLDWATLASYGAPDEAYGEVRYARGRRNATFTFPPLSTGRHELRVFFDSPGLEDKVLFRFPLWVAPAKGKKFRVPEYQKVGTDKYVYAPDEPVVVHYENFPGNAKDWMTVVPMGAPRDAGGVTKYTRGRNRGNFTFPGLPEGEYEVRAYYDWPMGGYRIQARYAFKVLPAGWDVGRYIRAESGNESGFFEPGAARTPDMEGGAEGGAEGGMDEAVDEAQDVAPDAAPDVAPDVAMDAEAPESSDKAGQAGDSGNRTADDEEANRPSGSGDGG